MLGDPPPEVLAEAEARGATVRVADGSLWASLLPRGSYVVRDGGSCAVLLVVVDGKEPRALPPAVEPATWTGDLPLAKSVLES